jgi:hypothetical protein
MANSLIHQNFFVPRCRPTSSSYELHFAGYGHFLQEFPTPFPALQEDDRRMFEGVVPELFTPSDWPE